MADEPINTVYCDGPPDNDGNPTHERYVVPFQRVPRGDPPMPPPQFPGGWRVVTHVAGGRTRKSQRWLKGDTPANEPIAVIARDIARGGYREVFRLRCERCSFNEERRHHGNGSAPPEICGVLDRLVEHRVFEISMRALVDYAWPPDSATRRT
jgi:hypothetical protein